MKSRIWIIGAVIILVVAASAAIILPKQSLNTNVTPSNQQVQNLEHPNLINITVKTDGTHTTVRAMSNASETPKKMLSEMKNKAYTDVQSTTSTVNSLKADMESIAKKYNYTAEVTIVSQFGTDQLPFSATVNGTSMIPTLQDGQNIMALKTNSFKVGDIVIARHPTYGLIVKRVAAIKSGKVFLKSDNRQVVTYDEETTLPDGVVEITSYKKTPLDTWLPTKNVIGVVKDY